MSLKVMISAKPILWDKVICRNSAFPFQTLISPGLPSKIRVNPLKLGWVLWFNTRVFRTLNDPDSLNNINLNLNSLLVKRQTDNPSPGAVTGGN